MKIIPSGEDLLRELISSEILERKTIAEQLHSKKSDISAIRLLLYQFENENEEAVLVIKQALDALTYDLKEIREAIFPQLSVHLDIRRNLKNFLKDRTPNIEYSFIMDSMERFSIVQEVNIFKACTEILSLLTQQKTSHLRFSLYRLNARLEIDILDRHALTKTIDEKKTQAIAGLLIFLKAEILNDTDWQSHFHFTINLQKP